VARPQRLTGFSYVGRYQYSLTFCTESRILALADDHCAVETLGAFRRAANEERFSFVVYCLMPDHAHLLVEGTTASSDLRRFAKLAKQHSGAAYASRHQHRLWQPGYFDRVLRSDEDARDIAGYILNNPVRAGLVRNPLEYAYSGSDVWSLKDLLRSIY